jgi:hypothetical protein
MSFSGTPLLDPFNLNRSPYKITLTLTGEGSCVPLNKSI